MLDPIPPAPAAPAASRRAALLGPMRLPFLLLAPVCAAVGTATAAVAARAARATGAAGAAGTAGAAGSASAGPPLDPWHVLLVMVGAVAAHIAVNALNEYDDFRSGLDLRTRRTPFSGGSGTLPQQPQRARWALATGLTGMAVAAVIGLYFWRLRGAGLLLVGVPGLALTAAYTPLLTRSPLLCLVAPGLGFGTCMVLGAHFALSGVYTAAALVASCVPFFLVSGLLLLNQFPDLEADRAVGRRHLIIVHGLRAGVAAYGVLLAGAFAAVVAGAATGLLPRLSLSALATLPLAAAAWRGARRHAASPGDLIPALGQNVVVVLLTPLLLAAGIMLGR